MLTECIARERKRPLLSLTVADLGSSEELMERRLSTWFRLAEFWRAIILIDEADVFLEERVPGDLRRNCLIAGTSFLDGHYYSITNVLMIVQYFFGLWSTTLASYSL